MNMQRTSRFLATGAVALALIGGGVAASVTDHWTGTQNAPIGTIIATPPANLLTVASSSDGAVVDANAKTVTFADYAITTADSPTNGIDLYSGPIYDQMSITSTGTGPIVVTATVTTTLSDTELANFRMNDGSNTAAGDFPLSTTPVVVATATGPNAALYLGMSIRWAGLSSAASNNSFTVTYSIDAS